MTTIVANALAFVACKRIKFYAPYDEDAFFEWAKKISCITDIVGKRDTIVFTINRVAVGDEQLRNLIALFRRYKISLKKLEVLINDENQELFDWCRTGFSINVYPAQ